MEDIRKNLVVVGDGACGKTSLLVAFKENQFPSEYVPTVFETYVADVTVNQKKVALVLYDTAGQEVYTQIRAFAYRDANITIICFSVDSWDTYENIELLWVPEVKHHCPNKPFILVATKTDLRDDADVLEELAEHHKRPISTSQGKAVAERINADGYYECSAKNMEGIQEVFQAAAALSLNAGVIPSKPCCVLL